MRSVSPEPCGIALVDGSARLDAVRKRISIGIITDLLQVGLHTAGDSFVSLDVDGTQLNAWTAPRLSDGSVLQLSG